MRRTLLALLAACGSDPGLDPDGLRGPDAGVPADADVLDDGFVVQPPDAVADVDGALPPDATLVPPGFPGFYEVELCGPSCLEGAGYECGLTLPCCNLTSTAVRDVLIEFTIPEVLPATVLGKSGGGFAAGGTPQTTGKAPAGNSISFTPGFWWYAGFQYQMDPVTFTQQPTGNLTPTTPVVLYGMGAPPLYPRTCEIVYTGPVFRWIEVEPDAGP